MDLDTAIRLWFHYEEIAMHFNELVLNFRLKLMEGAGILALVSLWIVHSKSNSDKVDKKSHISIAAFLSSFSFILLLAAAVLDLGYYHKLLSGAVTEIIELEAKYEELNLSTRISQGFGTNINSTGEHTIAARGEATKVVEIVYGILLIPLGILTTCLWIKYFSQQRKVEKSEKT